MIGLKCEICGHLEKYNLKYHLESVHNLTTKEYRKKNPNSRTMTGHSKRTVEYWLYRGFSEKQAKQKVKEYQGNGKHVYIQKKMLSGLSKEEAQKEWNNKQAENSPRSLKYYEKRNITKNKAQTIQSKLQAKYSALSPKFTGHKHREGSKKLIASASRKRAQELGALEMIKRFRNKDENSVRSTAEIKCYQELKEVFPTLICNVTLGTFIVDMKLEDIVIEFYGDFWHRNPKSYLQEQTFYGKTSKEVWEKDKKRVSFIKSLGFDVYVIWESDWNNDKSGVIRKLNELYESKNRNKTE